MGSLSSLLAVLDAAESFAFSLANRELPAERVLRIASRAAAIASATTARHPITPAPAPARAGGPAPEPRDDTDELLGRALGVAVAFDEGPEGAAEEPPETDEVPLPLVSFGEDDADTHSDELDIEPEPEPTLDVEPEGDTLHDDEEITHKSMATSAPMPAPAPTLSARVAATPPAAPAAQRPTSFVTEDNVHDDPSVDEVIVSKQAAVREVETLRASLPPGHYVTDDRAGLVSMEENSDDDVVPFDEDEDTGPTRAATPPPPPARPAVAAPREAPAPRLGAPAVAATPTPAASVARPYLAPQQDVTIRDASTPKPRAAAIQLGAGQGEAEVVGDDEEEELIEVGGADNEDELDHEGGGLSLQVEEYEDDDSPDEEAAGPDPAQSTPTLRPQAALPSVDVPAVLKAAHHAVRSGDLDRGTDLFSDVLDADPTNVEAMVGRGRIHLDRGDFARAMSDLMSAEEAAPKDPEPRIAVGDLYFARKDYRRAIDYFDLALELQADHAMAHCRRGISHYYRKNYDEALADLNKAQRLDPEIPNIATYVTMAKKRSKR